MIGIKRQRVLEVGPVLLAALLILFSCTGKTDAPKVKAAYYWSTTLRMDSVRTAFIRAHGITRLYVRYFDVVDTDNGPLPNATLAFNDSMPENVEIVPVVFITNECMAHPQPALAELIAKRVLQMNETNDVAGVKEIQIDCDWTVSTRQNFFQLLTDMRTWLKEKGVALSATIRLHQLSQPVPPVDRGVLMLYNTGDVTRLDCEKPILDIEDVKPYLKGLRDYGLPLASAYPLYRWHLLFRQDRFVGVMHADDDLPVIEGDTIVVREPALEDILAVKEKVDALRPGLNDEVILYELNDYNTTRFEYDEYEKIFGD